MERIGVRIDLLTDRAKKVIKGTPGTIARQGRVAYQQKTRFGGLTPACGGGGAS